MTVTSFGHCVMLLKGTSASAEKQVFLSSILQRSVATNKNFQFINPGQTPVLAYDGPLLTIGMGLNWRWVYDEMLLVSVLKIGSYMYI